MSDHRQEAPGENGAPVPRDMPDQQAHAGDDPWEAAPVRERGETDEEAESAEPATDVPDTDEAGTGRRGVAPHSGSVNPEHPVPDEPSA
ncbi:hypothetical protein ABZV31_12305 [Streptomyces sp. NPDC005202]|uniref:hypothetical protein n=1 Tax=Streptomyces sp. NPDC005202 TaxID=3157021 RepID=UPI0033A98DF3